MLSYYTTVILLCLMALGVLCILVHENDRLQKKSKRLFYLSYALIALSALAEWLGVQLDGRQDLPKGLLMAVKCANYILTPMAGAALAGQLRLHSKLNRVLRGVLIFNAVLVIVSAFFGWLVRIDDGHRYSHGPLYILYILVYIAVLVLVVLEFTAYGRKFRRQNRNSLYAMILLIAAGVALQEILGSGHRTVYLALSLGAALVFIHNSEFSQLALDDHLQEQQILISTDALTGMLSRFAYSQALRKLEEEPLPERLAVFSIDINELKKVNDSQGHIAGDELICGAAQCIRHSFDKPSRCFRTGGDEFVVLAEMDRAQAEQTLARLDAETLHWTGERVKELRLSAGFALAAEHAGISPEKLVIEADKAMYAAKSAYYIATGHDRRRFRQNQDNQQNG